jgi:hypothetical protein
VAQGVVGKSAKPGRLVRLALQQLFVNPGAICLTCGFVGPTIQHHPFHTRVFRLFPFNPEHVQACGYGKEV